ncbi:uncharacterized protein LOC124111619 isoform X1 [Haliotis rufescens]|uniref:uncharacterized protein LOC124111619 isoform X1 n=1 Tax=Haliotis rufescens TaxID=6454 RepID=UPI001EB00847|nr:uncharacterized protein LOC124111619 isoform X1 [Haliotis rufescens]
MASLFYFSTLETDETIDQLLTSNETFRMLFSENGTNASGMADYNDYAALYENHCSDDFLDQSELKVSNIIKRYIYPIILFIGTVGNLTSIRYLHNLSVNVWSTCLYLTVLSFIDLVTLYVDCGNKWFEIVSDINLSVKISETSGAVCKVYPFIFQFFLHFSPWIVVATSVELTIASKFPHLTYKMCTRERAKAVMLLTTVLLLCLNMHYFWTYGLVKYAETPDHIVTVCVYIEEFSEYFRDQIWPFINLAVGHIAPLVVVTACFFITISSYLKSDNACKVKLEQYFMDLKSLQQLRVTFIVICLFYVIVVTMKILLVIVNYLIAQRIVLIPCALESRVLAVMMLLGSLWDMLFYLFLSVKFFIYMATCTRFRYEIYQLVCRIGRGLHRKDRVTLTSGNRYDAKPLMQHGNNVRNSVSYSQRKGLAEDACSGVTTAV